MTDQVQPAATAAGPEVQDTSSFSPPEASKLEHVIEFKNKDRPRHLTVKLAYPLVVDGVEVGEINIRRMTAADVVQLQKLSDMDNPDDYDVFALMCDQPAHVLRALDAEDALEFREKSRDFLPRQMRAMLG